MFRLRVVAAHLFRLQQVLSPGLRPGQTCQLERLQRCVTGTAALRGWCIDDVATGKHALGDRARKLDQGILITRFELPYHIWWYVHCYMSHTTPDAHVPVVGHAKASSPRVIVSTQRRRRLETTTLRQYSPSSANALVVGVTSR